MQRVMVGTMAMPDPKSTKHLQKELHSGSAPFFPRHRGCWHGRQVSWVGGSSHGWLRDVWSWSPCWEPLHHHHQPHTSHHHDSFPGAPQIFPLFQLSNGGVFGAVKKQGLYQDLSSLPKWSQEESTQQKSEGGPSENGQEMWIGLPPFSPVTPHTSKLES